MWGKRTHHAALLQPTSLEMRPAIALLSLGALVQGLQLPFELRPTVQPAESSPAFISSDGFTTVSHPEFGQHSVRIKNTTSWCDPDTRSYTGYLDAGEYRPSALESTHC